MAKLWVHNNGDEWNADKDDWADDDGAFFVGEAPITDKENTNFTVYTTVVPANYGVLVLHDKDANGKMKTNGVGKPREGVGQGVSSAAAVQLTRGGVQAKPGARVARDEQAKRRTRADGSVVKWQARCAGTARGQGGGRGGGGRGRHTVASALTGWSSSGPLAAAPHAAPKLTPGARGAPHDAHVVGGAAAPPRRR